MTKKTYTVQLRCPIVVSKEIKADSMDDALKQAKQIAQEQKSVKPERGWDWAYSDDYEVVAVLA